jgi:hypothetical protein
MPEPVHVQFDEAQKNQGNLLILSTKQQKSFSFEVIVKHNIIVVHSLNLNILPIKLVSLFKYMVYLFPYVSKEYSFKDPL